MGTTKDENDACHSGLDPESRCKKLDTGSRRYDDLFSYKTPLDLNQDSWRLAGIMGMLPARASPKPLQQYYVMLILGDGITMLQDN
jgi:hypothetical protein